MVLIVDDVSLIRLTLRAILEEMGFRHIEEAKDGVEAIDLHRQHRPRLIILDINMPYLNGISAMRIIRSVDPYVKIMVCSAYSRRNFVVETRNLGVNDFLVKPIEKHAVMQRIKRVMEGDILPPGVKI